MFPDLVSIGFLHLKTYGACMAVGFFLCWCLIEKLSGRKDLSNFAFALLLAGVTGSRAAYVIEHWNVEFAHAPWWTVFRVDQGGLMFFGGLILAILVYAGWCWRRREDPLAIGDLLAAVIPLGHACGRIGCFMFGCCYGKISNSPLAVRFPAWSPASWEQSRAGLLPSAAVPSLPVLPTQLFEAAGLLVLFAVLLLVRRFTRGRGIVAGCYLMGYAVLRFGIECLRGDPRAAVGPFSISQTISFGMFALGAALAVYGRRSDRKISWRQAA